MIPLVVVAGGADAEERLGEHLRRRSHLFVDDWEPLSPVSYAATVWSVATAPVMTPPYARVSPALWGLDCRHGDEPGTLVVSVEVRMQWPDHYRDEVALRGWADWCQAPCWGSEVHQLTEPGEERPAALFSARLRVPIPEDRLPTPVRFGETDASSAKLAITTVAEQVNGLAGPVVAQLRALDVVETHP